MVVENGIAEIESRIPDGFDTEMRLALLLGIERRQRLAVTEHSSGVARNAVALAKNLRLEDYEVEELREAAILHDIGKLAIPDSILRKPGKLDPDEMAVMKQHAMAGYRLLGEDAPRAVREVARFHHERYDGHGYEGLKGENIPLYARIVCIADVLDALTQERDYKRGMPEEDALIAMTNDVPSPGFGRRGFDPFLLRRFVSMRLASEDFVASPENRATLEAYARTPPMDDVPGGWEENEGWHVKASGHRIRYCIADSGNRKMLQMRGPTGHVQFRSGPKGNDVEAVSEAEDAPRM